MRYIIISSVVILMASFVFPAHAQSLEDIDLPSMPTIDKPIKDMTIPELRAKISEILAVIQQLQDILAQLAGQPDISGIPSNYTFDTNLKYGTLSQDIKYLQIFLNADPSTQVSQTSYGSPGNETIYFGPKTLKAVIRFQEKYASEVLSPWNISNGTGYVGTSTRKKINQLLEQYRSGIAPGEPLTYCGDGIIQTPNGKGIYEVCDSTNLKSQTCYGLGYVSGTLSCSSDCITYNTANCSGGGRVPPIDPDPDPEPGPRCGDNTDNTCPSGCVHAQDTDCTYCGDNILQRPNNEGILEICDNSRLNNETCITQGFTGGALLCSSNCLTFNIANCTSITPPINHAPILNTISNKAISENQSLAFIVSATDPDNDPLTYSVQSRPSGASFNAATGTFTWTPSYAQSGTYALTFTVSDSKLTDTETITITVSNINRAPVLTSIGNKFINENGALSFTISAADPDNDPLFYSIQNRPSGASFNAATGTFTWTPSYAQSGTYNVTFIVSDTEYTDTETITITVNNINRAPVLTSIGNKSITVNTALTFTISAQDPDNDPLTYSAANLPSGATFNAFTKTFSWTPSQIGSYNVTFIVSDGALTDMETITITVFIGAQNYTLAVNAANGTVTKNPNQTNYASGTQVTLTATPAAGYTFSSWSGDLTGTTNPAIITMNSNKTITANFNQTTLSVDLTVSTDSSTWQNSLSGTAPLTGVDLRAVVSGTATGTINYSFDCNNDDIWDSPDNPEYKGITQTTKEFTNGCSYLNPGTYTAKVMVERNVAIPVQDTVTITVNPVTPICGDGSCNGAETCSTCPQDCGPCFIENTYYIDTANGNDNNDGSYNTPWRTITFAKNAVSSGDTIIVRPGDYSSEGTISLTNGGAAGNMITIKSEPRRQAVIAKLNINAPYIRIEAFEITNDIDGREGGGIIINSDNIEIIDNYIHHIWYMGISSPGSNNVYIADNYMYHVGFGMVIDGNDWIVENNEIERLFQSVPIAQGGSDADFSRFFGRNHIIRNNYFHGNVQSEIGDAHTDCFQTYNVGGSFAHNITIEKNRCEGFFIQGVIARTSTTGYLTDIKIRNNIFAGNGNNAWGVMGQNLEDVVIVNNVISNIRWYGVGLNDASDNAVIMNNIFYNIAGEVYYSQGANLNGDYNIIYGGGSTPHIGAHDLVGVNPLFVNPAIFDFRLQSNSPAINAGINTSIYGVIEDIVGTFRPQGAGYDIGAYEYEYTRPSCGDGVCGAGENCPADAGNCADNICYEPTCINGCGQTAVIYGGNDESCLSPNMCNGAGNCIAGPCAGITQCSGYTVQNECENNDCGVTGSCQWNAGVCEPASIPITTSISQFGITWTFSGSVEYGQFANGDYWVVGPVTIININPASGNDGTGRIVNGSMINPSPTSGYLQGYDSTMYGSYGPQYYTPSLNVARPNGQQLSSSNPLTIQTGSLVSTIGLSPSHELYGRTVLQTAAVLTVLSSPVPEGSFRPPYSGSDKTIKFNKNQLDHSSLARLAPVASTPRLEQQQGDGIYDSVERMFERPWLDHIPLYGGMGRQHHPTDNMPNYGGHSTGVGAEVGIGALMLNLDYTNQQKETLLIRYVQTGIDQYGIIQDGGRENFIGAGAQTPGHKLPILFAGVILNDNNMRNIGSVSGEYLYSGSYGPGNPPPDYVHFGEDDQTFYVAQLDVDATHSAAWRPDARDAQQIPYDTGDIGLPEWGIVHADGPERSNKYWVTAYRTIAGPSFPGMVLATHIMDIRDLWNHDALFDYTDRYMDVESGYVPTLFVRNMWNTYRDNYGCVWTRYNQSDIYSNGHNPCE